MSRTPTAVLGQTQRMARLSWFVLQWAIFTSGCGPQSDEAPRGLLRELARELDAAPAITPRLSIWSPGMPCIPAAHASLEDSTRCAGAPGTKPSARIAAIAARAHRAVRDHADADAMHAAALIDLLYDSGTGKSLQRTISSLQSAARLADRPAPVLADLAAAYIVRAELAHAPRDLLAAIEASEEALEREPGNRPARYNLALAMERFGLIEETVDAWRAYLESDTTSGWAREAGRHLNQVLAIRTEPMPPAPDAPLSAYGEYAAAEPQRARELGFCRVLGAWAEDVLAGNTAGAEEQLRRANVLGTVLERRSGGDATLADGVRAIRANPDGRSRASLAHAHRTFAAGCAEQGRVNFPAAALRFDSTVADAGSSPVLRAWARMMYGSMIFRGGDMRTGEKVLRETCRTVDPVRHPGLASSARLALSALLLRADRYERGLEYARQAAAISLSAGETENYGVALDNISIAYFYMRDMDQGYDYAQRALQALRPHRKSFRLHNMLGFAGQTVADDGFPRAAVRMLNEGVRVAERTGTPGFIAEAHLIRARLLAQAGDPTRARADMAAGQKAMAKIPGSRAWMTAQFRMTSAAMSLATDAEAAAGALDSATVFFLDRGAPLVAFRAIVGSARARLAAGDAAQATGRLETALGILENRRDSVRMEPRRAAIFNAARSVVDRVTMLKLASGSAAEALAYMDWGRASLAPVGRPNVAHPERAVAAPPGEVALEYALVADTLLVWTVFGRRVEVFRTSVDTVRLSRSIERLQQQLEVPASEAELRPALAELYQQLVRPVESRLGGTETPLVVVADGDLASVPFAALYDRRRGRYLVEDRQLRFAASLHEAWRRAPRSGVSSDALFIADPAFDPSSHDGFPRLPAAAEEVQEIAAGYPRARTLSDTAATGRALLAALARASVLHYAGHAVFDDERPERSFLLLASAPGSAVPPLRAMEIAQLDLSHLSLVVLAACRTVRTGPGRASGFSGLAGAFLAAGAGGAVGSLWEVDDRLTRSLMVEFHNAYRVSENGPGALRQAQLQLLASSDPVLRSPAAWAGFRYVGGKQSQ